MSRKIDLEKLGDKRNYGNFIKGYLDYTEHLESPTEFHVWTAISIIGGALQGKCYLDMGYFKWKPNCFIIFVAPPGVVAKSTTSGVGTDLLRNVPGIEFGPSVCTWQAMLQKFQEVQRTFTIGQEKFPMSCLTLEASELGTFLDFEDKQMIDVLVDLWDGKDKEFKKSTVGGGEMSIESPWVNLIACTTPSWIQSSMPQYSIGGGFTSRCIFVYADKKEKFIPYPDDYTPPGQPIKRKHLIEDLARISLLKGAFKLSDEARQFGREWYVDFNTNPPEHLKDEQLAGYAARKQTHLHKIAMCLSASRNSDMVIELEDMKMALSLLAVCEQSMGNVFSSISDDYDSKALKILRNKMIQHPKGITRRDLYCELSTRMGHESFERALNAGIAAGFLENVVRADGNLIRPTERLYEIGMVKVEDEDKDRVSKLRK